MISGALRRSDVTLPLYVLLTLRPCPWLCSCRYANTQGYIHMIHTCANCVCAQTYRILQIMCVCKLCMHTHIICKLIYMPFSKNVLNQLVNIYACVCVCVCVCVHEGGLLCLCAVEVGTENSFLPFWSFYFVASDIFLSG